MAALKYVINDIGTNDAWQCYLIRNQAEGGIGANIAR